jgi:hypothetical protein
MIHEIVRRFFALPTAIAPYGRSGLPLSLGAIASIDAV